MQNKNVFGINRTEHYLFAFCVDCNNIANNNSIRKKYSAEIEGNIRYETSIL